MLISGTWTVWRQISQRRRRCAGDGVLLCFRTGMRSLSGAAIKLPFNHLARQQVPYGTLLIHERWKDPFYFLHLQLHYICICCWETHIEKDRILWSPKNFVMTVAKIFTVSWSQAKIILKKYFAILNLLKFGTGTVLNFRGKFDGCFIIPKPGIHHEVGNHQRWGAVWRPTLLPAQYVGQATCPAPLHIIRIHYCTGEILILIIATTSGEEQSGDQHSSRLSM